MQKITWAHEPTHSTGKCFFICCQSVIHCQWRVSRFCLSYHYLFSLLSEILSGRICKEQWSQSKAPLIWEAQNEGLTVEAAALSNGIISIHLTRLGLSYIMSWCCLVPHLSDKLTLCQCGRFQRINSMVYWRAFPWWTIRGRPAWEYKACCVNSQAITDWAFFHIVFRLRLNSDS